MASMDFYRANSSVPSRWKHDVFLSFRGEDTRDNFVSHLHTALIQRAILTYKDDVKLETGEEISPQLRKAIQESRFSIVVLSKNYASSGWCLDELVEILECRNTTAVSVYPVFYYVDPKDVRKQTGSFGVGFAESVSKQRGVLGMEKVQRWTKALEHVANLSGWAYPSDSIVRSESRFIQDFVKKIFEKLTDAYLSVSEDLVGMPSRMEKVIKLLGLGMDDTRFVGICGMGGMGKTTIARAIYARFSCQFEGCSFIENVREVSKRGDLKTLQQQLISEILMEKDFKVGNVGSAVSTIENMVSRKKVLIVLDDVDDSTELENFVGKHHQFAFGSRIIITTRDEHVLTRYDITHVYKVKKLRQDEAIKLFKLKAFRKHEQMGGYRELVHRAVEYAKGVPLALKVLGSLLCGRDKDVWEGLLNKLKESPLEDIQNVLRISYDALRMDEKSIFLDIACFFKGKDKNDVTKILQACGFHPIFGIDVLVKKSLITISADSRLMMHDLIQELGWNIVREESPKEPGERSRLWLYEDITHALMENTETKKVEGIFVEYLGLRDRDQKDFALKQLKLRPKVFLNMPNLRILRICCIHLLEDLKYLSNKLSYLDWCGYPMKYMPSTFQPKHLVELHLTYSSIEQLWEGTMHNLDMLRIMNLSHSTYLTKSPDFTRVPNLEILILEGCTGLVNLHPSIGILRRLIFLNLRDCKNLKSLPSVIQLESIEVLIISGCSKLKNILFDFGYMKCLSELYLDGIGVSELPPSVGQLTNLGVMILSNCKNLRSIPDSICQLKALRSLYLSGCSKLDKLPQDVGDLDCLEELHADCTAIRQLPSSIGLLKKLKILNLGGCKGITYYPWSSLFWPSLLRRQRESYMTLELTALLGLQSLEQLDFNDCNLKSIPTAICHINSLRKLNLSGNNFESLPASMNQLSKLRYLYLEDCKWLQELPELSSEIVDIRADGCTSLKTILSPSIYNKVESFSFRNCFKLLENKQNNILIENFLSNQDQKNFGQRGFFTYMVFPGSEIPKWFSHQSMGSSVSFEFPPHWYNSRLSGIAIAVVEMIDKSKYPKYPKRSSVVIGFKRPGTKLIITQLIIRAVDQTNFRSAYVEVFHASLFNVLRSMEDDIEELNEGGIELQVHLVHNSPDMYSRFGVCMTDWEEYPFIEDVKLGVRLIYKEADEQARSIKSSDSEDNNNINMLHGDLDNSDSDCEEVASAIATSNTRHDDLNDNNDYDAAKGPSGSGKFDDQEAFRSSTTKFPIIFLQCSKATSFWN